MKGLLRILGICALSLLFPQFIFAQTWEQVYDIDIKDSGVSITETSDGGFAILAGHDHSTISSSDAVHLEMPRIAAQTGEIVCLPVKARNFTNITALQFSINFPVSHLSFAGVENFGLPNLGLPSFGYTNISLGQLGVSWDYFLPGGEGYSIPDESILFEICLEVIGTEGEHTISFSDEPITLAVIGTENSLLPVEHRDGSVHINLDWSQLLYYQTINIIRTDADGSVLWTTTLPADSTELANGLLETQDGGFVFGGTEVGANDSRAFIQKIDSDGTVVWKNILIDGSTNSRVRAITEAGDGGYLLTGTHNSDLFALKTDANGNELWRYTFDFGVLEEGTLISQLADGSFLISGYSFEHTLLIKINASGEAIWERAIFSADSYTSMVEASDGTLLLAGTQNIVAYDADGENPITYDLALEYIDVGAAFMVRANEDRLAYLSTGSTTDLGNDRNIFLTFLTENGQVLSTQQLTSTTLPMLVEPRDFVACANGGFAALNQLFQANGNQDVQLIKAVSDTQTTQGSIGDFVWEDRNGNGIQDLGEPGLPGVTINLLDGNGNQLATTTSAADGTYSFDGLAPGEYIVAFWAPAGFELVPANQGDDATDSDLDETTGQTGIIVIGSGETDNTVDAGFLEGVDLRLDKSVNVLLPPVGSEVEFTLRVRNDGASVATGVVVTDLLPSGYEFVSATGDYNPEIGAWNIGELANSTSTSMRIVARVLEEGDYLNMAEITAHDQEDIDSSPGNGVDTDGDGNVIDDPMDEDDGDAVNPFAATDLELDMSVNNLTPEVGEEVTFTVQVTNEGPTEAAAILVRNYIPTSGFIFIDADEGYDAATGLWEIETLEVGETATLSITAEVLPIGDHVSLAEIIAQNGNDLDATHGNGVDTDGDDDISDDPDDEDDGDGVNIQPNLRVDLELDQSVDNATPTVGDEVQFTLSVSNQGPYNATTVVVLDTLPNGIEYLSSGGGYDPISGRWNVGSLQVDQTKTLTIRARVLPDGNYSNLAEVIEVDQEDIDSTPANGVDTDEDGEISDDSGDEDDGDGVVLAVTQLADLSLELSPNHPIANAGEEIVFTTTVTNDGPSSATGIIVTHQLPSGYTLLSADGASYDSDTGLWSIESLGAGASASLHLTVEVTTNVDYTYSAEITEVDQFDPDSTPGNGVDTDNDGNVVDDPDDEDDGDAAELLYLADLSLEVSIDNPMANIEEEVVLTVIIGNSGPVNATGIVVTDQLPTGYDLLNVIGGPYDPNIGQWRIGTLEAGASVVLRLVAEVVPSADYTYLAEITAVDQPDADSDPNNGVDTDGDGNIMDDPEDEDDGDGVQIELLFSNQLCGAVFRDLDDNCIKDEGESNIWEGWFVMVDDGVQPLFTFTDENGNYCFDLEPGEYTVSVLPPYAVWEACPAQNLVFPGPLQDATIDLGVSSEIFCPLTTVSATNFNFRPCRESRIDLEYCNEGQTIAENAYVEVRLDPMIAITLASLPFVEIAPNIYRFEVGNVLPGICKSIRIDIFISCEAEAGQALCYEAEIFPSDNCYADWTDAILEVEADCTEDLINFEIRNVGAFPMSEPTQFMVIEDNIILMTDEVELGPGGLRSVPINVENNATYRLEVAQIQGFPTILGEHFASATIEGCDGVNPGFVNQFPLDDGEPYLEINCVVVTNSYDPNDKQAVPEGYGEQHNIRPNTNLDYTIRFQNTGTDTAFTVIIRDEIPLFLDLCTLKPGASSHPYELEIVNSRTLKFTFDNILLPDSTTNEPLSNGYVTYEIAQVKDLPLGTVITNDAAIYFDFNAPIITNETMHTIAEDFILVSLLEVESNSLSMQVVPNPTSGYCQIDLVGTPIQSGVLQLLTAAGQLVYQQTFQGQQIELDVSRLPKGLYWFTLATKKGQYARGKIAVK